jgi:hypothetical protein
MAEVRLQGARVGALVRKLKAASVPNMCGCALKPSFAATPSRATILRQPAVVKGEPRSPAAHSGLKPSVSSTIQAAAVFAMVDPVEAQEHGHAAGLCP